VSLLLLRLPPLSLGVRALAPPSIHRGGGHRAGHQRERLGGAGGGGLQRGSLAVEESFDGFPQVFDRMKPIDYLYGLRGSTAHALGVEGTPIATDDADGRILREPGGHAVRRALVEQVQHPLILQIDQDGPVALPPPPRLLIHADDVRGRDVGHRGCLHQPQQGIGAGPPLEAGRQPGACLATEGQAQGAQVLGEPQRPSRPRSRHGGQAFRKNLAWKIWRGHVGWSQKNFRTRRGKRTA
jgi:hypothetical protein